MYLQHLLACSDKLSVFLFVYSTIFYKKTYFLWKLCRDLSRVLSWWSKCIKLFLYLSLTASPQGSCFGTFLSIITFLCSSISWEPFNCFILNFFQGVFGIILRVISLKNLSTASLPLLGTSFRYFGAHFGVLYSISWELFHLILWNFVLCFLYYCGSQCPMRNLTARIPLKGRMHFAAFFGPILSIFLHVLRNLKHSLDFFCSYYFTQESW